MSPAQFILIFAVRVYRRVLSPAKTVFFGPAGRCRFTPSCSQYALESIQRHGARRGSWLALRRICRCHPFSDCGHDPVPESQLHVSPSRGAPGAAHLDTTTKPAVGSLSPRRRSGERVRERGFQKSATIRWKEPLSPTLSPLVPLGERGHFSDGGWIKMRPARRGQRREPLDSPNGP